MPITKNLNNHTITHTPSGQDPWLSTGEDAINKGLLFRQYTESKYDKSKEAKLIEAASGYSHTGAFADKPLSNNFVWEAGAGVRYTQDDVNNELWKVFSLNRDVHNSVDNPYWSNPTPSGVKGIGLFQGGNLPDQVNTLIDYDYSYNDSNLIVQNAISYSFNFNQWTFVNNITSIATRIDDEGNLNAREIGVNGNAAVQQVVRVEPNRTYSVNFKAKQGTQPLSATYVVFDKSNGDNIIDSTNYAAGLNSSTFTDVSFSFTTPSNCYEITFKIIQTFASTQAGSIILTKAQINEGATLGDYFVTNGTPSYGKVINHGYYNYANDITGYENTTGRIKLNDIQVGDQLRVRFDFNVVPQIPNTTVEPALWYSNRNDNDEITFSFPLTTQPIFYGTGTVGKTYLNRPEISAWITSTEDINALALPAIKSDNQVIIQPLGLLITIIR